MMKKCKPITIIAFLLALFIFLEAPVSALQNVIDTDQSRFEDDISNALDEADSAVPIILGEIEKERDEYSKTFRLENGNKLLVQYSIPIHYKNSKDEWVNYDNTLKEEKKLVEKLVKKNQKEVPDKETSAKKDSFPTTGTQTTEIINDMETVSAINEHNIVSTEAAVFDGEVSTEVTDDTEMIKSTEEVPVYSNNSSNLNISFSKTASENNMVIVGKGDKAVSWGYNDVQAQSAKQIEDKTEYTGNDKYTALKNLTSKVKYQSAYKNVDIELISSPIGVKENIILNSKDTTNSFISEYNIGELKPKQLSDKVIALYNKDDEVEYYINAEYMYDAKGNTSNNLKLNIIDSVEGKLSVELIADEDWLYDSSRSHPIVIDPSFLTSQEWSFVQSTYIYDYTPNTCYGYGSSGYIGSLYTGKDDCGTSRSLIKMNNIPALNNGDMIIDATMNLYLYNGMPGSTPFSDTEYVGAYEAMTPWNQSTATWNNCHDYYSKVIDYVKFDTSTEPGWVTFNITKLFKGWFEGLRDNNGIMLKSLNENSCTQCAAYYSASYPSSITPRPVFQITYRNNKGIEDYWSNTSIDLGNAGTMYVNDYSGALTFIAPMATTASPAQPAGLSYIYNSYKAKDKYDESTPYTGRGWRMSVQQTLFQTDSDNLTSEGTERFPYVYTDADRTDHYFYKDTDSNPTKYVDEDGLNLELTIGNNNDTKYTITDKDKNKLIFNNNGLLRYIKDPYNNTTTINYSGRNITSIKDASDNVINFTINDSNHNYIKKVNDPAGRKVSIDHISFSEDDGGYISKITRPDNTYANFAYDSNGLLTSVVKSDGSKVEITYNDKKKVSEIEEYSSSNNTATPNNKITFDRSKYNTTVIQSSGDNGVWGDDDDITSTYQFDNWGRTKSVQSKRESDEELGAANYEYTSGTVNSNGSNVNFINRIKSSHAVGSNTFNYLKNHGFERNSDWTKSEVLDSNTFTGTYISTYKAFGKRAYRIKNTDSENNSAGQVYQDVYVKQENSSSNGSNDNDIFKLERGETYTLSGYIKVALFSGNQEDSGAVIAATSINTDGNNEDYYSERISEVTDTNINDGWRRVSVTFTVPQNSEKIRVNIELKSARGSAFFDGMQLEKAKTAGTYNLLENSSFENCETDTAPLFWNNSLDLTYSLSSEDDGCRTTQHSHGFRSFKLNGEVTNNKYISQVVPVSGGEEDTYIVSGWAMAESVPIDSDNIRKFKISIAVNYEDGTQIFKESADFNPTISGWQYVSKAFNLSDGTSGNKTPTSIAIYPNYSKEGNAAYFDNFSLVREPSKSYTYDDEGNLISVASNAKQKSEMEYNTDNKLTNVLDPKGGSYQYTYNSHGTVDTATTQNGAVYSYEYDSNGNVKKAVGLGTDGTRIRSQQTVYYPSQYSYSYLVKTFDQRNLKSEYTYDSKTGTLTRFKDPKNVTTAYSYNANNDILTSVSKAGHTVNYSYDSDYRNLTGIQTDTTDYSLAYNGLGLRTQTKVGDHTLANYTYTNGGLLDSMTYGNNTTVDYHYDKFGNVDEKKVNNITMYEGMSDNTGAVTKAIDHVNNLRYDNTYDSTDRLISSTITNTENNKRKAMFEYDFDLNNNLSKLTTLTPNGRNKVLYTYGDDNRLTEVTLNNNKKVNYSYNGIGQLTSRTVTLPSNPITTTYTYHGIEDSDHTVYKNNLIRIETIGNNDFTYLYNYDNNNNIIRIYNGTYDEQLEDYSYDNLGQMTKAEYLSRNERHDYTYDNVGNITEEKVYDTSGSTPVLTSTNTYTYGDNSWGDLLTSYNGDTITYDAIGNPLQYRNGISFTWANGRQLKSYTKNNSTVNYTYDSNGMRLSKDVNGVKRNYLYNNGLLMQEIVDNTRILDYSYDSAGNPVSVAYRTSLSATPIYYYYAVNSRGDVVGIYTASGSLLVVYEYDAWGNILSVKNANGVNIANPNSIANIQSLRYRGYCYDTDSGLYYLQSRYYDPVTHRFINADGLVSTGTGILGYNMFSYCENNPVNCCDPTGCDLVQDIPRAVAGFISNESNWNIMDYTFAQFAGLNDTNEIYKLGTSSNGYSVYMTDYQTPVYIPFTVWIYDYRNDKNDAGIRINYSFLITNSFEQLSILELLSNFDNSHASNWNRGSDIYSMQIEWDVHTAGCYFFSIAKFVSLFNNYDKNIASYFDTYINRLIHVDIDNKDKDKYSY